MIEPPISTEEISYRKYVLGAEMAYADAGSGDPIVYLLPLRSIAPDVLEVYRRYWRIPGPSRQPMLTWTRELPIAGQPEDVVHTVESYGQWLSTSPIPKLFVDAEPAGFVIGAQREFCRSWPNQQTITVAGSHFLQEDARDAVGPALARFVAQVAAAQIASAVA